MQLLVDADPVSVLSLIGKVGIKSRGEINASEGQFHLRAAEHRGKDRLKRRTFAAAAGSLTLTTNMDVLSRYS